jgi:hypothetical protein
MPKPIKFMRTKKLPVLKKRYTDILDWEQDHIKFNDSGFPLSQHTCYLGGYQIRPCGISDIDYFRVGRALAKL